MLVKRNKNIDNTQEVNIPIEEKKGLFSDIEIKTFKQESIEVLNLLEKSGVNIYDPNRYGGMYLKRKDKTSKIPQSLKEKFGNSQKTSKEDNQIPDALKNFFNK